MSERDRIRNKIGHLKEVEALLLRGREEGLLREVRRLIKGYQREWVNGIRTGKWEY